MFKVNLFREAFIIQTQLLNLQLQLFLFDNNQGMGIKRIHQAENDEDYKPHKYYHKGKNMMGYRFGQKIRKNSSKWTLAENEKFLEFIKLNVQLLSNAKRRKQEKVFLQISKAVKTRSSDQCRSHHQKMIKHHGDLMGVIQNLEGRLVETLSQNNFSQDLSIREKIQMFQQKSNEEIIFKTNIQIPEMINENQEKFIWTMVLDQIWVNKEKSSQQE